MYARKSLFLVHLLQVTIITVYNNNNTIVRSIFTNILLILLITMLTKNFVQGNMTYLYCKACDMQSQEYIKDLCILWAVH